jgi:hypothetical protein
MHESKILRPKGYEPSPDLVQYIRDELHMKQLRRMRDDAGEELLSDEKRYERNLDKRKSTWMNKIFQEMADLIFFLECIATIPELKEEFEDEYEELLGLSDPEYSIDDIMLRTSFGRLIASVLQTGNGDSSHPSMIATYVAQVNVYKKIRKVIGPDDSKALGDTLDAMNPDITEKISDDIRYAMAWTKFLSNAREYKKHHRRVIYGHNIIIEVDCNPDFSRK